MKDLDYYNQLHPDNKVRRFNPKDLFILEDGYYKIPSNGDYVIARSLEGLKDELITPDQRLIKAVIVAWIYSCPLHPCIYSRFDELYLEYAEPKDEVIKDEG